MSSFLQLALSLAIIITAAKAGGYLSWKLKQPSVLGELLAGLILGPSILNFLHWGIFTDEHLGESVNHIAEIGVLLLMFIAGLDLHISDLVKSGKVAVLAGVLGVLLPIGLGFGVGWGFDMAFLPALFVGLILAATSVSISAQTLIELKVLRSRVGISLLGAAVFDDILVVLILSVLVALADGGSGGVGEIALIFGSMLAYLAIASLLGMWLIPRLSRKIDKLSISQGLIAFAFVTMLIFAWAAEALGNMAAITGAFLAGLMFARTQVRERIETGMGTLAYGVFVPIFFINVGLSADAKDLTQSIWLVLAMVVIAVISKIVGAGLGARLGGLSNRESLQLGVGMMSRGEVGLIVASLGIAEGIIGHDIFSVVVGVVIITTLLTPPMLHALFTNRPVPASQPQESKT